MMDLERPLYEALLDAMEWIDAVPAGTPLPAMPGFSRDDLDELLDKAALKLGGGRNPLPRRASRRMDHPW